MKNLIPIVVIFIGFIAALTIYFILSGVLKISGPETTGQPPTNLVLNPNPAWQQVTGYTQGFDECNSLCNAYRSSGCSQQTAIDYCNAVFSVDLDKSGQISGNEFGDTPVGDTTCETNSHCYDIVKECPCSGGQALDFGACVQLFYKSYSGQGFSFIQAYSTISTNLRGSCSSTKPQT